MASALGQDIPNIVHSGAWRLKLNDPIVKASYVDEMRRQCSVHNLQIRAVTLENAIRDGLQDWHAIYEQLDALRTKIMKSAENACRKFRTGKVAWSPSIAKAMAAIEYWKLLLKRASGKNINGRRL